MKKTWLDSISRWQISQGFTFATTSTSAVIGVADITVWLCDIIDTDFI
jgi:hypothetical protein